MPPMAEPICEWRALVMNRVDENALMWATSLEESGALSLPTKLVKLPIKDISKIAVVSWRWDGRQALWISKYSCCSAPFQANGIEYLFIDVVSINQQQNGDDFIK